jgi:DNA polymerase III subunit epsilon
MREIILDTETTGLDPLTGDRIVEIGCVEILNTIPTGQNYHVYINPERDMPDGAFRVHGLSAEFLSDKPVFSAIADEFLTFIQGAKLVIHNAEFDMRFINAELRRLGREIISMEHVIDTLALARRKHPGQPNSLDALCNRYGIDNSKRTKHGALLDSEILAEVYAELQGGRQTNLVLAPKAAARTTSAAQAVRGTRPNPLESLLTEAETAAHEAFIGKIGDKAVWHKYIKKTDA